MPGQTPQALAYLAEAAKCDAAAGCATLANVRTAYLALAAQWRELARQAEDLGIPTR